MRASGRELVDGHLGDESSFADDDNLISGECHLTHEMTGDEDSPPFGRETSQEVAYPTDPVGIEAVDRLVEQRHAGSPSSASAMRTLAHAEREVAHQLLGHGRQSDEIEHLLDTPFWIVIRLGKHPQVGIGATTGWVALASRRAPTSRRGQPGSSSCRPSPVTEPSSGRRGP